MKTCLFVLFSFFFGALQAQNFNIVAGAFHAPVGVETDAQGRIWITESGYGANDGAVSVFLPSDQVAWQVIIGLPSLFDTVNQEGVGPWHTLALPGNRLAVSEGATGKVLVFDLSGFVIGTSNPLTGNDAIATFDIAGFVTSQGIPESDPYSMALDPAGNMLVADAAANAIIKITPLGQMSVFATFPAFPNPLPFGPPMVDAVPTKIINKPGGGFYVCQLTGFPFLEGAASIFSVDIDGVVTPYATGLATLTDLALDANTGNLYALQIGQFVLDPNLPPGFAPNSAKVTRINPNGDRETVADNFDLSAGIALDAQGNMYATQIGSGLLLKWANITTGTHEQPGVVADLFLAPNPAKEQVNVSFTLASASNVQMRVTDTNGRPVYARNMGLLEAGSHQSLWQPGACPAGVYWVEIQTEQGRLAKRIVKEK